MPSTVQGRSLLDFGTDVARHLSLTQAGEWSAAWPAGEPSWCVYLTREDGARIVLGHRDYQNRFDASGGFQTTKGGNWYGPARSEDRVSITLADTKTPDQIAKDLARRLLPTYLPQYAQAVADQHRDNAQAEAARKCGFHLGGGGLNPAVVEALEQAREEIRRSSTGIPRSGRGQALGRRSQIRGSTNSRFPSTRE